MREHRDEATCVSLFSGVGGLDLGLHRAGFRHLLMCESDPWRRELLRARFPGVPVADDVRDVGAGAQPGRDGLPVARGDADVALERCEQAVDLLCGGFPCQDLSVAGQRRGLAGDRSGLFFEFARIADALRPRWVLVENVPGLLSSNGGRDFGAVVGALADIGYGLAWRVLDSRFFGVPQRRRRVFVVGALVDGDPRVAAERAGQVLAVGTRCPWHPATRGEAREGVAVASLSGLGTGGPDDNDGAQGRLVADPLASHKTGGGYRNDADTVNNHVVSYALNGKRGNRDDGESETFIANPLEASDGHHGYSSPRGDGADNLIAETVRSHPRPGSNSNGNLVAAPLTSGGHPNSNAPGRRKEDDENLVAGPLGGGNDGIGRRSEDDPNLATHGASVRRLTPTECERLQGFPDGWTQLGDTPDSRRYAALGDAVTVPVAEFLGRRILEAP